MEGCRSGPVSALPQTRELISKFEGFCAEEGLLPEPRQVGRDALLEALERFNEMRVVSQKLEGIRRELLDRMHLENRLRRCLAAKYKLVGDRLEQRWKAESLNWSQISRALPAKEKCFKAMSEEMGFFQERLARVEDEALKKAFLEFLEKYLSFLDRIHESANRLTTQSEALALEEEIQATFGDCPALAKKAKELREISKNKDSLMSILERIRNRYREFDAKKESLRELKAEDELDLCKIDSYERQFARIYEESAGLRTSENLGQLKQMKKSIESYLALRKKESDFAPLRKLLGEGQRAGKGGHLGKRDSLESKAGERESPLKKVKTGGLAEETPEASPKEGNSKVENGGLEIEGRGASGEDSEGETESLASLENSELSDADSACSNEFLLKQRHKIRKLKSLVIRKKEEQNDLVNQSDEKTSSFLHKKFSLMLLFFKLRVLGLDSDTCAKTEAYLSTVKATDELMKKTSREKVTVAELKRLVTKCEEMKYFSQGYQKFKRLLAAFRAFKQETESLRAQFRGGLRIAQEVQANFLKRARLDTYQTDLRETANGQFSIVLTRKKHCLFTKNSKKDWRNLNNKRKTKLRLGTESFGAEPKQQKKKKAREKLICAIYNQTAEQYCLCREPFELSSMIQFNDCEEWFHKECIKIPKYQMKRIKTKNCPACFFLHQSKCDKFPHFRRRKIPFARFVEILKMAKALAQFVLDERVDEIFYIEAKLFRLKTELSEIQKQASRRLGLGQDLTCLWTSLHKVAVLYIYLPVHIPLVENSLLSISRKVLEKLSQGGNMAFPLNPVALTEKGEAKRPAGVQGKAGEALLEEEGSGSEDRSDCDNGCQGSGTRETAEVESSAKMVRAENASCRIEAEGQEDQSQVETKCAGNGLGGNSGSSRNVVALVHREKDTKGSSEAPPKENRQNGKSKPEQEQGNGLRKKSKD